ncbi:hypothetical protein Taro_012804 [Colocasia esculenta]|uniref:BED-type domain-containing protein n=1 Tax=Colocasia esculenta TaxID=4460 RepID=A0A843UEL0_COLES|nr:hypothetical protein [Colocasia esculenta]
MASASENADFDTENIEVSVTQPSSGHLPKEKKLRSKVWLHFERVTNEDGSVVAICRYCQKYLVGISSSGTKHLSNHVMRCPEAQALKRSRGETESGGGELETPSFVFDNERSREAFAKMVSTPLKPRRIHVPEIPMELTGSAVTSTLGGLMGARHSCPVPSDSTGSSSLPEKGRMIGVSELAQ